jgi:hypothetical protein
MPPKLEKNIPSAAGPRKRSGVRSEFSNLVLSFSSIQRIESLQLAFESKSLRSICESEGQAQIELHKAVAETLKHRLADLRSATSVKDLLVGRPTVLPEPVGRTMGIDLCEGYRLIFAANHASNPMNSDNFVDWNRVTRVKILRIEKDNG